jgi:uncharacterized protein (TIGR02271 family)
MQTDPSASMAGANTDRRQLIAVYETYDRARSARDELISAGIPANDVEILDTKESGWQSDSGGLQSEGFWGALKRLFTPEEDTHEYAEGLRRGHTVLAVRPSAEMHGRAVEVLERTEPLDFDARVSDWRNEGWNGRYGTDRAAAEPVADTRSVAGTAGAATGTSGALGTTGMEAAAVPATEPAAGATAARTGGATEERIPVVEEQLRVGKREVSGGNVRVRSYVVERPVEQQVSLHQESVHVDRQAVDEPVRAGDDPFHGRTVEVAARSEEAVIGKETRVREEVVVRKGATDRTETVKDKVRRTEVEVDEGRAAPATTENETPGATVPGQPTPEEGTVKP